MKNRTRVEVKSRPRKKIFGGTIPNLKPHWAKPAVKLTAELATKLCKKFWQ